jgi:adenine-specific DNA-methyltransferase
MTNEPAKVDLETPDLTEEKRKAFEGLFPGVLADGVLDAARLGALLDTDVSGLQDGRERYGLMWAGKQEAVRSLLKPSRGTLVPDLDRSVDWDTSENVFIEGDNLEVLKLLQKAYNDKVKLIYIDPPYNTGNDFVYDDDFSDGLRGYLEYTGQLDEKGNRTSAEVDKAGRYHSRWLSMMYPRLVLARNLLRQDGVIFVSIDDNESHNLRAVMDEVFGPENHVADVVWQKKYTRSNDARFFSDNHEYLLVYARRIDLARLNGEPRSDQQNAAYKNPDGDPKGPWKSTPLHAKSGSAGRFSHTFDNGFVWTPPVGTFPRFSHQRLDELERSGAIWFGAKGDAQPSRKTYLSELDDRVTPTTLWLHTEVGNTHEGNNELKALGLSGVFNNPKPTRLLRRVLQLATSGDDLVLDFFAGSGSMAHAVAAENLADAGTRRIVSVNLPEATGDNSAAAQAGFESVSAITHARIEAVMGTVEDADKQGLRSLRLDESSFVSHDPEDDSEELQLEEATLRGNEFGVYAVAQEVLVKEGVPLDVAWVWHEIDSADVVVADDVAVVLTVDLTELIVKETLALQPRMIIFLEDGFADADAIKANAFYACQQAGITMKTV